MNQLDNVLTFKGNVRKVHIERKLDFSNVTETAIENLAVAKAVIVLQDSLAREAKKQKVEVSVLVSKLPETIDMSEYVNDYSARTDKEVGVGSFERTKKSVEKMDKSSLNELKALIEAQLKGK